MSKVQLQGNVSGTGVFTIASPNSNTDRTLTLPDNSGTVFASGGAITATTGTFSGIIQANGGGIQFPATQVSSGNANTLDDYEEGTWSWQIFAGSTGGQSGTGVYTKIGRVVTVALETVYATAWPTGGVFEIRGLPFGATATAGYQGTCWSPGLSSTFRVIVPTIQASFYPTAIRFADNSRGSGGSWIGNEFNSGDFVPSTTFVQISYFTS